MDTEKIAVIDEEGKEIEFDILFTFDDEESGKSYVLYYDEDDEEAVIYASVYDQEGNLFEIEDQKEWDMIEEVYETFVAQEEEAVEHTHECGCQGHNHSADGHCCGSEGENCGCTKE